MRIYGLPDSILLGKSPRPELQDEELFLRNSPHPDSQDNGLGPITLSYDVTPIPSLSFLDFAISDSINIPPVGLCSRLSMVAFDGSRGGGGHLVHFCAEGMDDGQPSSQPRIIEPRRFAVPRSTSIEAVKVGTRGHRVVWLEHNWDLQQFRLMKLSAPVGRGKPSVGVLLPPDPELPFSPRECQSLAFDEVTGRVCLGLYTGDLYILDFV